jgi:hypothetical protein
MSETTKEEAQLLVSKYLSKCVQEWAGGEGAEEDQEAGDEFARLVIDALDLRIIAVEADVYTAQININNINKEASTK